MDLPVLLEIYDRLRYETKLKYVGTVLLCWTATEQLQGGWSYRFATPASDAYTYQTSATKLVAPC